MQLADRNQFNQLKHAIVRGDLTAVTHMLTDVAIDEATRIVNLRLPGESSLLHMCVWWCDRVRAEIISF